MTQLLIDADFTLFQACSAVEREAICTNAAGHAVHVLNSAYAEALDGKVAPDENAVRDKNAKT